MRWRNSSSVARVVKQYKAYLDSDIKRYSDVIDITPRELFYKLRDAKCYYCGSAADLGLDRIDNKKGHTQDNVLICCTTCNMVRGFVLSVPQMEIIGAMLAHMKLPRRGFIIKGEFDYNKQTKVSIPGTRVNKNKYDTKLMDRAWERSRRRRAKLIEAGLLSHTGQRMVY